MEDVQERKREIRNSVKAELAACSDSQLSDITKIIENRLFEFANFLEAKIVLLYVNSDSEVGTRDIIKRCYEYNKIVVLPAFDPQLFQMTLMKIDKPDTDLKPGPRDVLEPDPTKCKEVPIESVDIAIIPGIAFDEKGGRIGSGQGYYDRLIPTLAITTRKVSLAFESQILQQIPMESHDKHVDIIITEKRIIYKI
jgi:5-formyltetrahydrofolate cyclo-ligase